MPVHRRARPLALAATLLAAVPATATLGGRAESVERDRIAIAAHAARVAEARGYRVSTLAQDNGGQVREFAGGDGIVFAVAWAGPARPDLRRLLGDNFAAVQTRARAGAARPALIARRARLAVRRTDLVVVSRGHPGGFHGFAFLPDRLPAGFPLDALR